MAKEYPRHLSDSELRLAVLNGGIGAPGFSAPSRGLGAMAPAVSPPQTPPAPMNDYGFRKYLDAQQAAQSRPTVASGAPASGGRANVGGAIAAGISTLLAGPKHSGEMADRWAGIARDDRERNEQEERASKLAALSDPGSEQSAAMRQRMAPVLMQMGLRPEEISGLSAADINQIGAGNLVQGLAQARQKSEASKAAAEAEKKQLVERRTYEEGRDTAKAEADQAEWDRRNDVTSPQRIEEAALAGGASLERMKEMADYNERKRIDAEQRKLAAAKAKEDAKTQTVEASIENFENANKKLFVSEPGTFAEIAGNPRTRNQRQVVLATSSRALDASERLLEIDREYAQIPMMERAGDHARALASEYEQLKNEHQGIILKIAGSGSGAAHEREEIKSGIPSIYNPLARARLEGIESMLRLNVEATLAPYGIGVVRPGQEKPPRAAVRPSPVEAEPSDNPITEDEEADALERLGL